MVVAVVVVVVALRAPANRQDWIIEVPHLQRFNTPHIHPFERILLTKRHLSWSCDLFWLGLNETKINTEHITLVPCQFLPPTHGV